jgi:hypothetical protein
VANHVFTAGIVLLTLVATTVWGVVLVAILVGRGIGRPKDGRRGFWFAIVLFLPVIGTIIYALVAMPDLPRIDPALWISTIVVTVIAFLATSAIQETTASSRCRYGTDGDLVTVFCETQAPSIAVTVGVTILAAAITAIVVRRQRLRQSR